MLRRLLIRTGGIGDCILSIPAMQCLRADFTEVWVPAPVVPVIQFADRVRAISGTGIDLLGLPGVEPDQRLIAQLRSFDSIVSWYGANREEFRQALDGLGLPVQFLTALPDESRGVHCCDFFLDQAGCSRGAQPEIACHAGSAGAEYGVIHPFSGSARKNWPLDRFRALASRLPVPVAWCAGPEEDLAGAVRFGNLYDLGCWLRQARFYVGNDSGITHLAAAVGAPVVAIFGPSDPKVWAPRAARARIVHGRLADITIDEVLNATRSLLLPVNL